MSKKNTTRKTVTKQPEKQEGWDEFIEASTEIDEELGRTTAQIADQLSQMDEANKKQKNKRFSLKNFKDLFIAKYKYYAIISPSDEVISILHKKENVTKVLMQLAYKKYEPHFLLWCEHHGYFNSKEELIKLKKTLTHNEAWKEYFRLQSEEILNYLSAFSVKELFYSKESVATILRMFNHCIPFDTDEESEFERLYYNYEEQLSRVMKEDMDGDDLWKEEKKKNKNVA